ncbi:SRPBCC family protein [Phytoactinopolyspora halophila]|nr:SRPBCC family protein [Phytoactinopolyspora halophila]
MTFSVLAGFAVLIVIGGVVVTRVAAPPSSPPEFAGPHPDLAAEGYVSHTETIFIGVPRDEFYAWVNDPQRDLSDLVEGTDDLPAIKDTENLRGNWDPNTDRAGHRRRVEFETGHYVAEEVLVDSKETFRYMIWGFTNLPQRLAISHAVAEFTYEVVDDGTQLTWTYSFQPTAGLVRPFLSNFVDGTMSGMMQATLAAWKDRAEADLQRA